MVIRVKIAFLWKCVPAQSASDISTYPDCAYLPKKVPGIPEPQVPAVLTPAFKFPDFLGSSKTRWGHWKDQEPCKDRKSPKTTSVAASVLDICENVLDSSQQEGISQMPSPSFCSRKSISIVKSSKSKLPSPNTCVSQWAFLPRVFSLLFLFVWQLFEQGTAKNYHCWPDLPMPSRSFWAVFTKQMKMENLQGLDGKKSDAAFSSLHAGK